jgi:hypothetical protein
MSEVDINTALNWMQSCLNDRKLIGWKFGTKENSRASTQENVMEITFTFNQGELEMKSIKETHSSEIYIRESWTRVSYDETGSTSIPAYIGFGSNLAVTHKTNVSSKHDIEKFLEDNILYGSGLALRKKELIQAALIAKTNEQNLEKCVTQAEINNIVQDIIRQCVARVGAEQIGLIKYRLQDRVKEFVYTALRHELK